MTKKQFLDELRENLRGLPREEVNRSLDYYSEIISDKMESGMSESLAVASLGEISDIARSICGEAGAKRTEETGNGRTEKQEKEEKRARPEREKGSVSVAMVVLAVLTSPLWIGFAIGGLGLLLGFYATVISLVIGVGATAIGVFVGGIALLFAAFLCLITGSGAVAMLNLGVGLLMLGFGLLLAALTKPLAMLSWRLLRWPFSLIRKLFVR